MKRLNQDEMAFSVGFGVSMPQKESLEVCKKELEENLNIEG